MQIVILESINGSLKNTLILHNIIDELDQDQTWGVQIKKYNPAKVRTLQQNRYLHAICDEISKHVSQAGGGYYIGVKYKKVFSLKHFGLVVDDGPEGEILSIRSTADLSTKDFGGLVEFIIQYAYDTYGEYEVETPEQYKKRMNNDNN